MEVQDIQVETSQSLTLPWQETLVMPVGDLHYLLNGGETAVEMLKRHLAWGMKYNAYFLGMGDYLDVASPSNRRVLKASKLYEGVVDTLEAGVRKQVDELEKILEPTKGRWLGLLEGHHFYEFDDGTTSDTILAERLGTTFLGTCAFVRLRFKRTITSNITCTIWCHHGVGGGQKQAAPLNKLENLVPYFDADIYLMAHQHKKPGTPIDQTYLDRKGNISHRTRILACTGSFYRAYQQGSKSRAGNPRGGYVEQRLLNPSALGGVLLKIRPVHTEFGDRLDLNIEL